MTGEAASTILGLLGTLWLSIWRICQTTDEIVALNAFADSYRPAEARGRHRIEGYLR